MPHFDTHAVFTTLHTQGFSDQQATALTTAFTTVTDALMTTAALTASQQAITGDLEATRTALTTDLATTRTALQSETRELRVLMESRFQTIDARFTFTHWMIGIAFTVLFGFSLGNLWLLVNLLGRLPRP